MKPEEIFMVHPIANTGFSRTYIIEGRSSLMVVDVESVGAARDIEEYITGKLGRSLKDLQYITATHFHIDHIEELVISLTNVNLRRRFFLITGLQIT